MSGKKIPLLVSLLFFVGIIALTSCGCIETGSESTQIGNNELGLSVVEHKILYGLLEPEYDLRIWVMGSDVVDVQGIKKSELKKYVNQYMKANSSAKNVVYTPVDMESSGLNVIGDVHGLDSEGGSVAVDTIRFTLGLVAGGSPVNFSTVQMVFATRDGVEILNINTTIPGESTTRGYWTIVDGDSPNDMVLEGDDKFTILVMPSTALALSANQQFNLEIRPSVGGSFNLKRTVPAKISGVNVLV